MCVGSFWFAPAFLIFFTNFTFFSSKKSKTQHLFCVKKKECFRSCAKAQRFCALLAGHQPTIGECVCVGRDEINQTSNNMDQINKEQPKKEREREWMRRKSGGAGWKSYVWLGSSPVTVETTNSYVKNMIAALGTTLSM